MPRVALLTGGDTAEREVALRSTQNVRSALKRRFEVQTFVFPDEIDRFLAARSDFDVAVPVFHGRGGEDGMIQGFLETLGVPYIFSGVEAHAMAINKVATKHLVRSQGVQTPDWRVVESGDSFSWNGPVVLKPVDEGSSIGVQMVRCEEMLEHCLPAPSRFLCEKLIDGREFTVAVVDHGPATAALPVVEIRSKKDFFDFESKYDPTLCDELCPAPIEGPLAAKLQDMAVRVHNLIGARHLSRTDMIIDTAGEIWFLEINTIPGLTRASLAPKAIAAAKMELGDLFESWINDVLAERKTA